MDKQLAEWTVHYVKNKDLTFRKLVKFEEHPKEEMIEFEFKDKKVAHFILDKVTDKVLDLVKGHEHKVIVCLNNEENFKFLIKDWKKVSEIRNLSFLFVNLKGNDKWVINPHTHSMIADPASIESGLRTMYDTANGKIAEIKGGKKKASMFESSSSEEEEEGMDED
jgi:hypothetical protein